MLKEEVVRKQLERILNRQTYWFESNMLGPDQSYPLKYIIDWELTNLEVGGGFFSALIHINAAHIHDGTICYSCRYQGKSVQIKFRERIVEELTKYFGARIYQIRFSYYEQ